MKIRIKSHSIRFRVDNADLEKLRDTGMVRDVTHIPNATGEIAIFTTEVRRGESDEESQLQADPFGLRLLLSPADCESLALDDTDGVYLRREWTNDVGHQIRFVAYIEKDNKARKHGDTAGSGNAPKAELL